MTRPRLLFAALLTAWLSAPSPALAQDPGYALRFDGISDFVRLPTTATVLPAGWETTKTVSLWLNPMGTAACTSTEPITCDAVFGDRPRAWGISRGTVGGNDRLWVFNYDGTIDKIAIEYTVGEWVQVALVHGGGYLSAYKNGALVGSIRSGATPTSAGNYVLQIGGIISNATLNWTFSGEIDEVQVWSVARTAEEIAQTWNLPLVGTEPGLAAYYTMSNGSGLSLADDSGHGRTGTLSEGGAGVPADGPIQWVPSGALAGSGTTNTPPVADPQTLTTLEDAAIPVTLTGSDVDNDPLTFMVATQPTRGTLSGTAPDLTYTPLPDTSGSDSFTFVANDGHVGSLPATVTITVLPSNDPPVASDDVASARLETAVVVSVLANDGDPDGDTLTVSDVGAPSNGTVTSDGTTVTYVPLPGFVGDDSFAYTITDGHDAFATATVTVSVRATEDPGLALKFNGSSNFVALNYTASMLAPGWKTTKTVSVWVRPTGPAQCRIPFIGECDSIFGDRPQWWGINIGTSMGLDRIWVSNWDGNLDYIGIPYTVGEWIQVTMVHGNGWLSAYKNGVLVGSVPSGATVQPTPFMVLTFGGIIMGKNSYSFDGEVDEVQLWNVARTQQEILDDMNRPLLGTEPGLAAYYGMSDGSGTFVADDSGHGWTGRLYDGYQQIPAAGPIQWIASGAFIALP